MIREILCPSCNKATLKSESAKVSIVSHRPETVGLYNVHYIHCTSCDQKLVTDSLKRVNLSSFELLKYNLEMGLLQ